MLVRFSKKFAKQRDKAPKKIQVALNERLGIFYEDRFYSKLNNHALVGSYKGYRSINVSGDWRALYREIEDERDVIIFFDFLRTHSQLYK